MKYIKIIDCMVAKLQRISLKKLHQILLFFILILVLKDIVKQEIPEDKAVVKVKKTPNVWSVVTTHDSYDREQVNIVSFPDEDVKYDCHNKYITITASGVDGAYLHLVGNCESVRIMGVGVKVHIDHTDYLNIRGSGADVRANTIKTLDDEGLYATVAVQNVKGIYTSGHVSKIYYVNALKQGENVEIVRYRNNNAQVKQVKSLDHLE